MGRLIFADKIEEKIEVMYLDYRSRSQVPQPNGMILVDEKLTYAATVAKAILDMVKNTKTAYDAEKIIEQLEERMYDSKNAQVTAGISMRIANANYHHGKADAFNKAIEIVRKGGGAE